MIEIFTKTINRRILLGRKWAITSTPECWKCATFIATCSLCSHSKKESNFLRFWRLDLENIDKSDDRKFTKSTKSKNFARSEMSHNESARVLGMGYLHSYVSIRFPFKNESLHSIQILAPSIEVFDRPWSDWGSDDTRFSLFALFWALVVFRINLKARICVWEYPGYPWHKCCILAPWTYWKLLQ